MATPKSTLERVMRKIRLKKPLKTKKPNLAGRVVPKKTGNNDPTRNHNVSEAILRLYEGEEVEWDINEMISTTNNLISAYVDGNIGGDYFDFERLTEMRDELNEHLTVALNEEAPLPVKYVLTPRILDICPHCNSEIGEKSVHYENFESDKAYHSDCGKPIHFINETIKDPNGNIDVLGSKMSINKQFVESKISLLSDFYAGKNGVHAILETELDGNPAILFITENGNLPLGCPSGFGFVKIISEKGKQLKTE